MYAKRKGNDYWRKIIIKKCTVNADNEAER